MAVPAVEYPEELTPQMRAALLTYHLFVLGRAYTTDEVAGLLGISERGALYVLTNLSAVEGLPLTKLAGHWMSYAVAARLAEAAGLPPLIANE